MTIQKYKSKLQESEGLFIYSFIKFKGDWLKENLVKAFKGLNYTLTNVKIEINDKNLKRIKFEHMYFNFWRFCSCWYNGRVYMQYFFCTKEVERVKENIQVFFLWGHMMFVVSNILILYQ